ncbi:MAG: hypothetical protein MOB07_07235 [Acidobacteria bacterium]|nr:hypothetical protein [Acidobacteriota bacterium]
MATAISAQEHEMTASIVALNYPLPDVSADLPFELIFPEFDYSLSAPLIERSSTAGFQWTTIKAQADEDVLVVCRLKGSRIAGSVKMRSEELAINFEIKSSRPRARFVAATLQAMLGLSGTVRLRIPSLDLDAPLQFSLPLDKIARLIHSRWISYQLMVINRACELFISEPPQLSRQEQDRISFAYDAIVERGAERHFYQGDFSLRADEQTRALVDSGIPFTHRFVNERFEHEVLGDQLNLGPAVVTAHNAVFIYPDEALRELKCLDGHEFKALIRAQDGVLKYEFADAPRLPARAWDEQIAGLVKMEKPLDELHFDAVNNLAAATLAGMTEEEMQLYTQPLHLDEEAFADPEI